MTTQLNNFLDRFSQGRVAVLGDIMLDTYLWGQVTRISPEAPVPVVNVKSSSHCLGGAANVLRNLATLKAGKVYAFGIIGSDQTAEIVINELKKLNINASGVLRDYSRRTTEKRRIMAGSQQLLREDFEDVIPVSNTLRRQLVDEVINLIRAEKIDAIIFEDYAKGVLDSWMLEEIIAEAQKRNIPTALDPKPGNLAPVRGLTVMKPNRTEAFAMARMRDDRPWTENPAEDANLLKVAERLLADWEPDYLLLSLAAQGLSLFHRDSAPEVIPTRAREVYDVSGAGDTVTATFALSLVSGADPGEAAELANRAAGIVVGRIGTAPIIFEELKQALKD